MEKKIAVATVSGKAYYLIVNELKKRNMPFLSLTPSEPIPIEVEVTITTEEERPLINHGKILVFRKGMEPEALISQVLQIVRGKKHYEKIIIGVDPGEVLGLAVLADGKVVETGNYFSVEETIERIKNILKNSKDTPTISVKVGDGILEYKEKLLQALDEALSSNILIESVREAGTNQSINDVKHRRGLRDIVSAIRIAGREGHMFVRERKDRLHS